MKKDNPRTPIIRIAINHINKDAAREELAKHPLVVKMRTDSAHDPRELISSGLFGYLSQFVWLEEHAISYEELPHSVVSMLNFFESYFQQVAVEERITDRKHKIKFRVKFILNEDWLNWYKKQGNEGEVTGGFFEEITNSVYVPLNNISIPQFRLGLFLALLHEFRHRVARKVFNLKGEAQNAIVGVNQITASIKSRSNTYPILEEIFTVAYEAKHTEELLIMYGDSELLLAWEQRKKQLKERGHKQIEMHAGHIRIVNTGELTEQMSNYRYYLDIFRLLNKHIPDIYDQFLAVRRGEKGSVSQLVQSIVKSLGREALIAIVYGGFKELAMIYVTLSYCDDLQNPNYAEERDYIIRSRDAALKVLLKRVVAEDHPIWKSLESSNS